MYVAIIPGDRIEGVPIPDDRIVTHAYHTPFQAALQPNAHHDWWEIEELEPPIVVDGLKRVARIRLVRRVQAVTFTRKKIYVVLCKLQLRTSGVLLDDFRAFQDNYYDGVWDMNRIRWLFWMAEKQLGEEYYRLLPQDG